MWKKRFKIVGIGEVLFDILPNGEKMCGGAPANFAYILTQLGNDGIIASRIGNDTDGAELLQNLSRKSVDISQIQKDAEHSTGSVKVSMQNGQPNYVITENVAWDFIEISEDWRDLAKKCDAVCFGSLAQRNSVSRETIYGFVNLTQSLRVFDVNLRQKYFSKQILQDSFRLANVVKMNHEELPQIVKMFDIKTENQIESAKELLEKFALKLICVTRGGNGSLLLTQNEISEHKGLKIKIADTIGAGDAFTAAMTDGLLRGLDLHEINEKANKIGAFVASNFGAMPEFN